MNLKEFIKKKEGFRTKAYLDTNGTPTIGYGSTMWACGRKVKLGDTITKEQAENLLDWEITNKSSALIGLKLNENQYTALLSLIYNIGVGAFNTSTLKKLVKVNPNNPKIKDEFLRWNKETIKGKKVVNKGLTNRREQEAELYFS